MDQRCKICWKPSEIDYQMNDKLWHKVVPREYQGLVVCLGCFDRLASAKGINWHKGISDLAFVGGAGVLMLEVTQSSGIGWEYWK